MSLRLFKRFTSSSRLTPGFLGGFYFSKVGNCYNFTSSPASALQEITRESDLETESNSCRGCDDSAEVNWDELGFRVISTDYMYVMKASVGGEFSEGRISPYGNIELSPSAGVLNYGQGLFEGLKAYRKQSGDITLFRPEQNALRMQDGAERLCMPVPSVDQFVEAVKQTAIANKRWVPPTGKGALYLRPILLGSGAVLGLAPAPEYMFMVYASPVGNYFKEGLSPIALFVEEEFHRATRGGSGAVKTIGNYAPVLKAQLRAKSRGFSDVLFLDSANKRYIEEAASCNIFIVKDNIISTPSMDGTILSGITRKSIIEIARDCGYEVLERAIPVEELLDADEVFCTGTAVVVVPVGSIMYRDRRVKYRTGAGSVSKTLYCGLTSIQMGLVEDTKGWTVEIE